MATYIFNHRGKRGLSIALIYYCVLNSAFFLWGSQNRKQAIISVALSFPLVMFPCRTSLHSLLFRKTYQGIGSTELVTDYIPPTRFNLITVCLILFCLTIGILIPDIELVLGFVGSTMGASVCVIFPGAIFLKLSTKETTERLAARAVLVIGRLSYGIFRNIKVELERGQ